MQIILVLFAIATVIGSFAAWRQSPLYSLKTTLKLVGAFLAIIAVTFGATWAVFSGPFQGSQVAQGILAFLAVIALTIGASLTIISITDSHVAQLPPNVRLVTLNRHRIVVWIWRFLTFLVAMAVASLVVPESWFWLPSGLGGFTLLICAPMLSILYMMARRYDRSMTAIMANPWAHWQYSTEQWEVWAEKQKEWAASKITPGTRRRLLLFVLLCAGLFGLGALFSGGSVKENIVLVSGLTGLVVLMLVIVLVLQKTQPGRRYRHLLAAPPETWLGDEGLFANGDFWPWVLSGRYLIEAAIVRDPKDPPARLVFTFQSFNGSTSVQVEQRVLVPEAAWQEMAALQRKLNAQCPSARIRLS